MTQVKAIQRRRGGDWLPRAAAFVCGRDVWVEKRRRKTQQHSTEISSHTASHRYTQLKPVKIFNSSPNKWIWDLTWFLNNKHIGTTMTCLSLFSFHKKLALQRDTCTYCSFFPFFYFLWACWTDFFCGHNLGQQNWIWLKSQIKTLLNGCLIIYTMLEKIFASPKIFLVFGIFLHLNVSDH